MRWRRNQRIFALEFVEQILCPVTGWYSNTTICFLALFHHYANMSIIFMRCCLTQNNNGTCCQKLFRNILTEHEIYIPNEYKYSFPVLKMWNHVICWKKTVSFSYLFLTKVDFLDLFPQSSFMTCLYTKILVWICLCVIHILLINSNSCPIILH